MDPEQENKEDKAEEKKPEPAEEVKAAGEKADKNPEAKEEKKEPSEKEKYEQQISVLKAMLEKEKANEEEWKNKFYTAYADLDNTRKSLQRDHDTFVKYRAQGFIERILPTLDSFEMAAKAKITNPDVAKYAEGFQMIRRQLEQALSDEGVTFVEPALGTDFNAETMHAIQTLPGKEDNKIAAVYVKGYKLHDRLIRPAMVVVSKKEEEKKEETPADTKAEDKK